jgi:hypothetical protein
MNKDCFTHMKNEALFAVSSDQLGMLAVIVMKGVNGPQIKALNPNSCTGFKNIQIASLSNDLSISACSGFSADCLAKVTTDAIQGMKSDCIARLTETSVAAISAQQMAAIDASAFNSWKTSQIASFNAASCTGIKSSQLRNMNTQNPNYACKGFTPDCLSNIQPAAMSGFTSNCIGLLPSASLVALSAQQVSAIEPSSFSGWYGDQLSQLNPKSYAGMTSNHLKSLNNNYPNYACKGIAQTCITYIPGTSFSGMTADCTTKIDPKAMVAFSADQIGNITTSAIGGFTHDQITQLTNACAGFNSFQLASLNIGFPNLACKGISSTCMSYIQSSSIGGMKKECTATLPPDVLSTISSSSVAQFSLNGISGLTSAHLKLINAPACAGFQRLQIGAFYNNFGDNICTGLTPQCMANILVESYIGFSKSCVEKFAVDALSQISPARLGALSDDASRGLKAAVIAGLNAATGVCSGFRKSQLLSLNAHFPQDACTGFSAQCISTITLPSIEGMTKACIHNVKDDAIIGLTLQQLPRMTTNAVSGFSSKHYQQLIRYYSLDFVNALSLEQLSHTDIYTIAQIHSDYVQNIIIRSREVSATDLSTVTWLQLSSSTPSSVSSTLTASNIVSMNVASFSGIVYDIIPGLPADILSKARDDQLLRLISRTVGAVTASQLSHVPVAAFISGGAISSMFIFLSNNSIPGLTNNQLRQAINTRTYLQSMRCVQYYALTTDQTSYIRSFEQGVAILDYVDKKCKSTPEPTTTPAPGPTSTTPAPGPTSLAPTTTTAPGPTTQGPSTTYNPTKVPTPAPTASSSTNVISTAAVVLALLLI